MKNNNKFTQTYAYMYVNKTDETKTPAMNKEKREE